MLIPRYSVRTLLLQTVAVAVYCLFLTLAINGHLWAIGILAVLHSLIFLLILHALVFAMTAPIAWAYGSLAKQPAPTSPFATEQPPPQLVSPPEPE
jgi:hypothetical protein